MQFSADMTKLLSLFGRFGVRYVLVGGHAVDYYGYVRTTQDMDLLVLPTNSPRSIVDSWGTRNLLAARRPRFGWHQDGVVGAVVDH